MVPYALQANEIYEDNNSERETYTHCLFIKANNKDPQTYSIGRIQTKESREMNISYIPMSTRQETWDNYVHSLYAYD